jgi:PAS domain S-box-containing protein
MVPEAPASTMRWRGIGKLLLRLIICTAAVLAVTAVMYAVPLPHRPLPATLAFLFIVLIVAAVWGFRYAVFVCFVAALGFSWLLPPVGRFHISDSRDVFVWIAFLVIGITTSHLSDRARREALNANQRRAEAVAAQRRFADLVNSVEGIVWEADGQTFVFSFVSQQAERILGYPPEQWLREPTFWKDHLHPEDRDWAVQFCAQATGEKRNHDFEYRMIAADGRVVWLRDLVTVVSNGRGTHLRGMMIDISKHKQNDETLREQANLLSLTHDAIFVRDMNATIQYWNRAAEEMYGWTADEASGKASHSLLKTVFPVPLEQIEAELMRAGRWEGELAHTRKDGTPVIVGSRWSLQRNNQGAPIAILAINNDITEQKRAEQAQQEIEERWKAAFESNPTMYFIVDSAGTTVSVNAFGAEQLGYKVEELIGRPVLDVFYEPDREPVQNHANSCFQQPDETRRWEARKIRKDGRMIWVRETAKAVFLKKRQVLLIVCEDITEQKRAEEAARRSEKELRDLIETIPTMVFSIRPDGSTEFASRNWQNYVGLSLENTTGAGWQSTIHPDDLDTHLSKWRHSLASDTPFENEVRHRSADGDYRWFLVRAVPLRDEQGCVVKWYGTLTDIEDRKRAEALLTGEKRILEMVAKADSLAQILDSLCRLVEEQASGVLTSILLIEGDCLRHGGAPSLPKAYTDAIDGVVIGPSVGSCGTAAYRREQVLVEDIATDPLWADYREAALPHSLRACWSTPIVSSQGKVIGTFAMYYREPRRPSLGDQQIIEQITHLAGVAIERKLTQEALKRSEAYLGEAQRLTRTGSWAWDPSSDRMTYCSEELYRVFGLDPQENVPSIEALLQRVHPEDRDRVRTESIKGGQRKTEHAIEYKLLLPDGTIKEVLSIRHPSFDATGELVEIIGTTIDVTERKRAEHALRDSEELKRRIIESSTDCIKLLDLDGNLLFMSSGGQQLLEIDNIQPYLNTCWIDFWQPEDRPKINAALAAARAGGIGKFQAFCLSAKGTPRWWDVITTPICNADGQPEQLLSVSRDITESKRAEELLRESEGRFRTIFENVGAGITLVDQQGHPIKCNPMFEKMLGYTEEELRSMVFTDFTHPDDIEADWTLYRELVDGKRDRYELEKRYIKKDGRVMWGQLIVSRVKGKDGAFADYHVGMVEDITERKRAEQALQRSESYLAEAQRLTHTGSWAFNPATAKNNYWSEEMFRIFALDSQHGLPTSETFWDRVHPEDRDSVHQVFHQAAREKTEYEHDHRILLPDGTVKHIHALGHPLFNAAGDLVEFVGTSIDVTERKRAEQERERLQQLQAELARMNRVTTMGELTASLAHEINQPIAAAVTNASTGLRWLAIDPPNIEEAREAAKRSVKDANRAAEIIGRIRQLFRKGSAERELLDINEVIREMIVLLLNEAHRYSISLRTDLDTNVPSIMADRVQLQQVLMNLMLNGIDAVKDVHGERELTIKSGRQNRDLLISVTDMGKGLPEQEAEKIFDAFFTTKTEGTGMGLSISRSIIESHGGRLWAMNNSSNGATFYFTLPTNVEAQDDDTRWRSYGVHY